MFCKKCNVEILAKVRWLTVHFHTARSVSSNLTVPNTIVLQILRFVLRMFPYRLLCVQLLEAGDSQYRLDFANFFYIRYKEDRRWPLQILWTDAVHFILTGKVNSKNCVHWAEENTQGVALVPFYNTYVTIWCGVEGTFILGP